MANSFLDQERYLRHHLAQLALKSWARRVSRGFYDSYSTVRKLVNCTMQSALRSYTCLGNAGVARHQRAMQRAGSCRLQQTCSCNCAQRLSDTLMSRHI